jgi:hypothetical protein
MEHTSYWSMLLILICRAIAQTRLEAIRDIRLEINAEKEEYMIISHHLNSGKNHNTRNDNELLENVAKFKKKLGTKLTN